MNSRLTLVLSALAVLLTTSCSAITFSENAAIFKGDDPRLEHAVSYDSEGIPVVQALADLSLSAGVQMTAGLDKNDWMARDRKVIIHVKDMKLSELMQEIASILRFHWSRAGTDGKWEYYLWQDKGQRTEEDSLRASTEDAAVKQARDKRENAIADMANLGSLAEKDADNLKTSDPWRYILATEPLGRGVTEFMKDFPDARNAFVQGVEASFPVSALTPQLQDTVHRIASSYDSLVQKIGATESHGDMLSHFDKLQITINRHSSSTSDVISQSLLGRITIASDTGSLDIPLFDPASQVGKALGKAILSLEAGVSKDQVGKQLETEMASAQQATQAAKAAQTPDRDITSDPGLRVKIKLFDQTTNALLPMTLGALAKNGKLNVISDYFPGTLPAVSGGEKTLGEQLMAISAAYATNWEKAGGTLRFRDKAWFNKRAWEVPEVWMRYWAERGKINNGLQLMDMVQIGCLRDEQIDHTIMTDSTLVRMGAGDAARNRQICRFYGLLTDDERKSLASDHLSVSSLTDDQWAALQKALATKGAAYAAAAKGSQFVQLTQSGSSEAIEYKISYYPGANESAVVFSLQTGFMFQTKDELPSVPPEMKKDKIKKL